MDERTRGFEGLQVWQKAHQLMLDIHKRLVPLLPPDEKYDLAFQIRKSSKSVGANIAEGYGRFYYMDNVRFCYNARGSLDETTNHLLDSYDLAYCPRPLYEDLRSQADEVRRLLNGYIAWLKKQKIGEEEPGANVAVHELRVEYDVGGREGVNEVTRDEVTRDKSKPHHLLLITSLTRHSLTRYPNSSSITSCSTQRRPDGIRGLVCGASTLTPQAATICSSGRRPSTTLKRRPCASSPGPTNWTMPAS